MFKQFKISVRLYQMTDVLGSLRFLPFYAIGNTGINITKK